MEGYKGLLASKTVWMGVIALLGVVVNLFGYTLTAADQAAIAEAVGNLMSTVGSIGAIWFRVKATKVIG